MGCWNLAGFAIEPIRVVFALGDVLACFSRVLWLMITCPCVSAVSLSRHPQRTIEIDGPVLLLMGYIGTFFARMARHLEAEGVEVYKVSFPLLEYGFTAHQRLAFSGPMSEFRAFLEMQIQERGIRHVFMHSDVPIPHRIALDLCSELRQQGHVIDGYVFELGYLRPNYVTLERDGVNSRSALNKPAEFYRSLPEQQVIPQARRESGVRWRKIWKAPTFVQHAFTCYRIVDGAHKLQPKPAYVWAAVRGFARKYLYAISERRVKTALFDGSPFFLGVLQVATDSQLKGERSFSSVEGFITEMVESFARSAPRQARLFIKHHPRDRGYTNYSSHVKRLVQRFGLQQRVFYFHDSPLAPILRNPACRGVVLINSTVGYQTLFHGVPLKALGTAPFNIEGLADQQPLDGFWAAPRRSDRALFRRFYHHVLSTTQINGNFDGAFPFAQTFSVKGAFTSPLRKQLVSLAMVWRVPLRLIWWMCAAVCAAISLFAGPRSFWLRAASKAVSQALGLRICLDCSDDQSFASAGHHQLHGSSLMVWLVKHYCFSAHLHAFSTVVPTRERCSADLEGVQHVARPLQMEDRVIHWSVLRRSDCVQERWLRRWPLVWGLSRLWGDPMLLECKEQLCSLEPSASAVFKTLIP